MSETQDERESGVALGDDAEVKEPPRFAVYLLNDNYTSMEFVMDVLVRFFKKSEAQATEIMLRVHTEGRGVAGIYTQEIAEMKVAQVTKAARAEGFPLACTCEQL